jgi:hypothetical protein
VLIAIEYRRDLHVTVSRALNCLMHNTLKITTKAMRAG